MTEVFVEQPLALLGSAKYSCGSYLSHDNLILALCVNTMAIAIFFKKITYFI